MMYIYSNDETGRSLLSELTGAARRGVDVRIVIDAFGSILTSDEFFEPLREAGGQVRRFNSHWHPHYLFRNHQKFVIADSTIALIGGFNFANPYFGNGLDNGWREVGMRVRHPIVDELQGYFDRFWNALQRTARLRDLTGITTAKRSSKRKIEWLGSGPSMRRSLYADRLRRDLIHASRLSMMMGYFVPSVSVRRMIGRIARRGEVRLVLPYRTDVPISRYAAWFTYKRLLRDGCQIYEYQPRPLHAKLLVIDDILYVGSANLDFRSLHLNFEMVLRVRDANLAEEARRLINDSIDFSKHITQEIYDQHSGIFRRIIQRLSYILLSRFDYFVSRRYIE
jgi:cardiolipin synthase